MREERTPRDDGERGPRGMARGLQRGRHLKGETGPTNCERSAKRMQSGDPGPGLIPRSRTLLGAHGTALKYLHAETVERDERQLKAPQNRTDKSETILNGSHGARQRFARPYAPIILSNKRPIVGPRGRSLHSLQSVIGTNDVRIKGLQKHTASGTEGVSSALR